MKTIKVRPGLVESKDTFSIIVLDDNSQKLNLCNPHEALWGHKKLILISLEDEKICQGDSVVWKGQIFEVCNSKAYSNTNFIKAEYCNKYNIPKVIATQEQLSPELIQQLVDEYNNGGMQDFEIEMNIVTMQQSSERYEDNNILVNGEIVESVDYTLDDIIDKTIEKYNKPKLTKGFVTIVEKSDNFTKFLKERIDNASSLETKAAYTIVLDQYKKEILYTEEEVLNILDKYDEAKWGCPARKGLEEITFWFNQNKKK